MTTEDLLEKFYNQKPYFGFIALADNKYFLRIQAPKEEQLEAILKAEAKGKKRPVYEHQLNLGTWWNKEYIYCAESGTYILNDEGESFRELRLKHKEEV
jgi:hypothetical protein